jgi:hypothetical protein
MMTRTAAAPVLMAGDIVATPIPNLFDYATSELSQDAFVCWLAAWADPGCRAANEPLHAGRTAFVSLSS